MRGKYLLIGLLFLFPFISFQEATGDNSTYSNGIWLNPNPWLYNNCNEIKKLVDKITGYGIKKIYINVGKLSKDGTNLDMCKKSTDACSFYKTFVDCVHQANQNVVVYAWISGCTDKIENDDYKNLNLVKATRENIVGLVEKRFKNMNYDGVHLDIEPVMSNYADNAKKEEYLRDYYADPNSYKDLLKELREQLSYGGPNRFSISMATPNWGPNGTLWEWTDADFSSFFDEIHHAATMTYGVPDRSTDSFDVHIVRAIHHIYDISLNKRVEKISMGLSVEPKFLPNFYKGLQYILQHKGPYGSKFDGISIYDHLNMDNSLWTYWNCIWIKEGKDCTDNLIFVEDFEDPNWDNNWTKGGPTIETIPQNSFNGTKSLSLLDESPDSATYIFRNLSIPNSAISATLKLSMKVNAYASPYYEGPQIWFLDTSNPADPEGWAHPFVSFEAVQINPKRFGKRISCMDPFGYIDTKLTLTEGNWYDIIIELILGIGGQVKLWAKPSTSAEFTSYGSFSQDQCSRGKFDRIFIGAGGTPRRGAHVEVENISLMWPPKSTLRASGLPWLQLLLGN